MAEENQSVGETARAAVRAQRARKSARKRAPRTDARLTSINLAGEDRQRLIREAAYFRAEQRGFAPGRELEDWLAAELEIDAMFAEHDRA